jgi:hypothetical protein
MSWDGLMVGMSRMCWGTCYILPRTLRTTIVEVQSLSGEKRKWYHIRNQNESIFQDRLSHS